MSVNWRYATSFVTPASVTSSTTTDEHPATNVLILKRPRLTVQLDPTTPTLDFDLGTPGTFPTVLQLENTNIATMDVLACATADFASPTTLLSGQAVPYDSARLRRGRGRIDLPDFSLRYVRLVPLTMFVDLGFYELGVAAFVVPVTPGRSYGADIEDEPLEPRTESPILGGGIEKNREGPDYWTHTIRGGLDGYWGREATADIRAIQRLSVEEPWWVNLDPTDPTQSFVAWLPARVRASNRGGAHGLAATITFNEFPYAWPTYGPDFADSFVSGGEDVTGDVTYV